MDKDNHEIVDKVILGKQLRRILKDEMKLTQEQVANETGIDDKHIGKVQAGDRLAGTKALYLLRKHLHISIDELFDAVEKEMQDQKDEQS